HVETVARAPVAMLLAGEVVIGVIERGSRPGHTEPEVREVDIVKHTQHGIIADPHTIAPGARLDEAAALMERSGVGTLVVVDESRRLLGLLTDRDIRFVSGDARVAERMTPRERLVVHEGPLDVEDAERIMVERKVKKLPLVDRRGTLLGLVTAKDIVKHTRRPFATRDAQG